MTKEKLNQHKENMDKITERLGGTRDDIWQDRFIYDIALALSDILIERERNMDDKTSIFAESELVRNNKTTLDSMHAKAKEILERTPTNFKEAYSFVPDDYDFVNHPPHYETGKFECIDVMRETQGDEAVKNFCICNALKYIYRHRNKNGIEDVKKAKWYIDKYLEIEEERR